MHVTKSFLFSLVVALLASACGGDTDMEGEQLFLVREDLVINEMIWQDAPAGCEGRLSDSEVEVAWAEGAPSLAVVVDLNELALCVDTWESIEIEIQKATVDRPSQDPSISATH